MRTTAADFVDLARLARAEAARLSGRPDYRGTVDILDDCADVLTAVAEDIQRAREIITILKKGT